MDVISAACRYEMFKPGDKVVVAVSGGPDSVAMLHALHTRSAELGITLHVAHMHHGIRPEESNYEQDFVVNLAQSYGLNYTVKRVDVPTLRQEMKMGTEEAARVLRYKFLLDTYTELNANKIAVGHNADDRAESVLLNVIRGSGIDGIGSIRPIRDNIVRPLIDTTRREIEQYIEEHRLSYCIDETNIDIAYSRNRVRHELIPLLERHYNPNIKEALLRLASIASAQSDLMDMLVSTVAESVIYRQGLDVGLLNNQPLALKREIIREEIKRRKGNLMDISFEQVERIVDALQSDENFTITLPSGLIYAIRRGNEFRVTEKEQTPETIPFDIPITIPGETELPHLGLTIKSEEVSDSITGKVEVNEAYINDDSVSGRLRVRNLLPGDRIVPFGMHGSKKLQDVFVDKKIPRADRAKMAVVVDDEKVLWVVGVVTSELARVNEDARKVIHLTARFNV